MNTQSVVKNFIHVFYTSTVLLTRVCMAAAAAEEMPNVPYEVKPFIYILYSSNLMIHYVYQAASATAAS